MIFKKLLVKRLYKKSFKDDEYKLINISFLNCIKKTDKYKSIGEELVKNNHYGVVIMAGGLATRIGLNEPKGCIKIGDKSLFQIYIEKLIEVNSKYNITIPLYIMTSCNNHISTVNYLKSHNFFSYPQDFIKIFIQDDLPILDYCGKVLKNKDKSVVMGPNGNGDVFKALNKFNLINDMKNKDLEYLLFVNIDNPKNNLVDFNFIGSTIKNKYKLSSKTIKLDKANEWIFVKYKNKPIMIPSEYTKKLFNKKVNAEYAYRYKNISNHLIHIDLIDKFSKVKLPYHRAYKLMNNKKTFKFEKFIFDAFKYSSDMLLYEVDKSEFNPIKNKEDLKNYKNNH